MDRCTKSGFPNALIYNFLLDAQDGTAYRGDSAILDNSMRLEYPELLV